MTQVQAAYFKTPCLTMFVDPNDSFKDYGWGLSAWGNLKRLIKNTKSVVEQPRLWEKMADNGYRFADTVYNREVNLAFFKAIIGELWSKSMRS